MASFHRFSVVGNLTRFKAIRSMQSHACCLQFSTSTSARSSHDYLHESILPTMHFQAGLPRLPIPKLDKSCQRYLASQEVMLDADAFEHTKKVVEAFEKNEGQSLNSDLIANDKQNKHTSYVSDRWFHIYLADRVPVVLNYNPFMCYKNDERPEYNDQLIRATNLTVAALKFMKTLRANKLDPEVFHLNPAKTDTPGFKKIARWIPSSLAAYYAILNKAFPLDMSQYFRLFNSTRVPQLGKDVLKTEPSGKHLLVVRNGHLYTFDVLDRDGNIVPPAEIQAHLQYILKDNTPPPEHPLGYLTTENRDIWASLRTQLVNTSARNTEVLDKIDTAVYCLCLDETAPEEAEDMNRNMLYGDGANRWFDKSFQLIICKNGLTACNFEHSWGDGVAVLRFFNETFKYTTETPSISPSSAPASIDSSQCVSRIQLDLDPQVKEGIKTARQKYMDYTGSLNVETKQSFSFGKDFLKSNKVSPDSVMQLAFQMGFYKLTGKVAGTYESCSTAAFRHGRTETIRSATKETKMCSQAFMEGSGVTDAEKRSLMQMCSDKHNQITKEAAMGQGWDRHLLALRFLAQDKELTPDIFTDPAYAAICHIIISTSTLSSPAVMAGGFAPVVPNGFGVGYGILDNEHGVNITSYPASYNVKDYVECVMGSLNQIHDVLQATSNSN
ncbi:carnitine O-palmitoyltransferase 2, mitochondrial-like isoform X2 [Amphiura filiformis]|uniref:carnitine O-palmitoyltransferase 2, mitochondrial-like isoform X2 n=1 Tax=Amphiura filiformis TaxID=82378 RepID=UPI003B216B11